MAPTLKFDAQKHTLLSLTHPALIPLSIRVALSQLKDWVCNGSHRRAKVLNSFINILKKVWMRIFCIGFADYVDELRDISVPGCRKGWGVGSGKPRQNLCQIHLVRMNTRQRRTISDSVTTKIPCKRNASTPVPDLGAGSPCEY